MGRIIGSAKLTDNECYLLAKEALFPYECLGDLNLSQVSEIIHLAQLIKDRGPAILEGLKEDYNG